MANTILVPTDFSDQSLIALEQSYNIAKLFNASITLVNVIRTHGSLWGVFGKEEKEGIEGKIVSNLKMIADEVEEQQGIKVNYKILKGKVVESVIKYSNEIKPVFMVVGTTGDTNIRRKIIGTRALRWIKETPCPVLSIKGKHHRDGCENIILPLDLTKETKQKVELTKSLAKLFGSKIFVVSLITSKGVNAIGEAELLLLQVKKDIIIDNIECETELLHSSKDPELMAIKLIGHAHSVDADLITIMTQQENEFKQFFIGSKAKQIIFDSDIPVLTINPK